VLTRQFPSAGVTNFAINTYDVLENLMASRDELGQTNTFVYDPLHRLKTQVLPDGAAINLAYNPKGSLTNRVMPGGLTWSATFDNANRMLSQQLVGGTTTNRQFTYSYYTGGPNVSLLQTKLDKGRNVTNTLSYDVYLRPATNSTSGSLSDQNVTLSYQYDRRSLMTNLTQVSGVTSATTSTVQRALDGYVNGSVPAIRQLPLDTCSGGRDSGDGMARNLRIQYPGAVYHVMNREDRRESIFHDDGRSSGEMTRSKATWNLCQKFGPTPSLSFSTIDSGLQPSLFWGTLFLGSCPRLECCRADGAKGSRLLNGEPPVRHNS